MAATYAKAETVVDDLALVLGQEHVTTNASLREQHGVDESWHPGVAPEAVVFPSSTDEVARVVRACAERRVPIIPFGAGTSLEGHVAALHGGISIDLSRMDQVVDLKVEDLDVTVGAGMRRLALNERLGREGLFFPVDPGADASIGGMVATGASGTNAVRYGTMKDNVLALTAVTATGEVIRTGTRARKSSAGYDLTRLLVGSEGTLAVVTEVTLRVYGIPEVIGGAIVAFESLEGAVNAVIETIQFGIPVARIELLDEVMVAASNAYAGFDHPEQPTLFLEFNGSPGAVAEQTELVREIVARHGGGSWEATTDPSARTKLWKARHDALYAGLQQRPGSEAVSTDVCVPISRLAECIVATKRDIEDSAMYAPIVGHVGDGNFHVLVTIDPDDPDELERAHAFHRRLVHRAQDMGGTCTGEHGIGHGKLEFMSREFTPATLDVMRAVKQAFDPDGILNPGKLLPPA